MDAERIASENPETISLECLMHRSPTNAAQPQKASNTHGRVTKPLIFYTPGVIPCQAE